MGKKEQVPALRSLCRVLEREREVCLGSLWVCGRRLAVFHMVPRVPAAPTRGRPLVYRRVLTGTSPESLSCALAHIACGLHSASASVNTKLALQLVRDFAAYFRERVWPWLLMRGALAALSPCSWDLMAPLLWPLHLLSDGASPPAAPSLFGSHPPSPWWHAELSR